MIKLDLIVLYSLLWNTSSDLHLNKLGFLLPKNTLWKFWMNFAQRFWRKDIKILALHIFIRIVSPCFCESYALICEGYAWIRESYALIRERFAFIRESILFIHESLWIIIIENFNKTLFRMNNMGFYYVNVTWKFLNFHLEIGYQIWLEVQIPRSL